MAISLWDGNASITANLWTITAALTWANGDKVKTVLTSEDGSTQQSVETTVAGFVDIENQVRDPHLAALQASTDSLFLANTWAASGTAAITATAVNAGIPTNLTTAETVAGDGTWTEVETTDSSGPHDWNVTDNWENSDVPGDSADSAMFADGSSDVFYGLNQSAVTLSTTLNVGKGFTGAIGDSGNGYYLQINGTTAFLNSHGPGIWLKGTWTNVYMQSGKPTGDMLHLDGTITNLFIAGNGPTGTVTLPDSSAVTNVYMSAPGCKLIIGATNTITLLEMSAGTVECKKAITAANISGGTLTMKDAGQIVTLNNRGGVVNYNCSGTITALNNFSGTVDFSANTETAVTVTASTLHDGAINARSGLNNIVWTADPTVHGGELRHESATTPTP